MTFGAAFLFPGESAFAIDEELLPGAYVAVFECSDEAMLDARQAGLHLRDTLLVLSSGPTTTLVSLFRKPLVEATVAEQVLKTGTGGIHIDACRVNNGVAKQVTAGRRTIRWGVGEGGSSYELGTGAVWTNEGRWPSNFALIHDPECKQTGFARVEGHKGYPNGPGGSSAQFSQKGTATSRKAAWAGHADAEGKETVATWDCTPGCPVPFLDAMSGESTSNVGAPRGSAVPGKGWGMTKTGAEYSDSGGASRFFPQFGDKVAFLAWLERLILPPGAILLR